MPQWMPWVLAGVLWFGAAIAYGVLICHKRPHRAYSQYLIAPSAYWKAPHDVKLLICNGAGPNHAGWLVPDTMYGLCITEAANIHDWMYVWGDDKKDKEEADSTFLLNLIRIINEHTTDCPVLGWVLRWLRHRRALVYYEAVCDFGAVAYVKAKKARPPHWINTDKIAGLRIQETGRTNFDFEGLD